MDSEHYDFEDRASMPEPLDPRVALQLIIDNEGDCSCTVVECYFCPLANIHKRDDGTYMSCYASIIGKLNRLSMQECNKLYKQAAMEKLSDILIEDILSGKVI
jgi:hypothetical protein